MEEKLRLIKKFIVPSGLRSPLREAVLFNVKISGAANDWQKVAESLGIHCILLVRIIFLGRTMETQYVNLRLTVEQLNTLSEKLSELQDEGPMGEGWASDELEKLRSIVETELSQHEDDF